MGNAATPTNADLKMQTLQLLLYLINLCEIFPTNHIWNDSNIKVIPQQISNMCCKCLGANRCSITKFYSLRHPIIDIIRNVMPMRTPLRASRKDVIYLINKEGFWNCCARFYHILNLEIFMLPLPNNHIRLKGNYSICIPNLKICSTNSISTLYQYL